MSKDIEKNIYILNLYSELLNKTEKRGISYGEIAFIQSLKEKETRKFEKELIKELEELEKNKK